MKRRTFLKLTGIGSLSLATGCSTKPEKTLYSLVHAPLDMVTGHARWYASTCRECPAGCGILARNREGRVVKLEGNPLHPINRGKLCMRGQAALQGVYNPDRIHKPLLKVDSGWEQISFTRAYDILRNTAQKAVNREGVNQINRVRMLSEIVGGNLLELFNEALGEWWSDGPLIFEPFAYESLKAANKEIFNFQGLPSYRMDKADLLVSFGADFLETWLSPVEYARKFKAMHSPESGGKGLFFHISPFQSLTGANADLWISCAPGGEAIISLGLVKQLLEQGKGMKLPEDIRISINRIAETYTVEKVCSQSGIQQGQFEQILSHLSKAKKPLILGTGSGSSGINSLQANLGANLLNLILDPDLTLLDFSSRHRIEIAHSRSEIVEFMRSLENDSTELLLLNNVNPVYMLPSGNNLFEILQKKTLFVVNFNNFMDETAQLSDLIIPVQLPLESWDEYSGKSGMLSTLQPAMGRITQAPHIGDILIKTAFGENQPSKDFKSYMFAQLFGIGYPVSQKRLADTFQKGGRFKPTRNEPAPEWELSHASTDTLHGIAIPPVSQLVFMAAPSIRFFDGRGANRPWLCEIPDPLTQVAWHTAVLIHPETLKENHMSQEDVIQIQSKWGRVEAPVYETWGVRPGVVVMCLGQGHSAFGRYAREIGQNPVTILSPEVEHVSGSPLYAIYPVSIYKTDRKAALAHTDGDRFQHGRKIALTMDINASKEDESHDGYGGLTMNDFPFVLPLPEGYDSRRDIYPPHDHNRYRWAMIVDLDKCIGCKACSAACYAENNLGIVGLKGILEQREMSWIQIQRYYHEGHEEKMTFFPLLCQHCDNAPCESVCPVYAPHHSKEGVNNQIYNRCIGTRFCSQNCPYKARRFNWFEWQWPKPLHLQLNPDVTVRSKGVMEKCSFCIQRIKDAHTISKNENRSIRDGEIQPACAQTCPTGVFTFGNLMDKNSRVRKLTEGPRAYQAMGYLNTKPAVIYLKKVSQEL